MNKKPISADSHVTEPPSCYADYIDPKYRDVAPHLINDPNRGEVYLIPGMKGTIPLGIAAAAGKDPKELKIKGGTFADLHRSGWDPTMRAADQDRDGVVAEIIYPSIGMMICNHPDMDYKRACFDAYNRWLVDFCDAVPGRLFGLAQIAVPTPQDGIMELEKAKEMGFKGVMVAGTPGYEDWHHPDYDPFYAAAVDLNLPLSFHILTSKNDGIDKSRGPRINGFLNIMRGNQDIIGTFIFGGVFQRHPKLKLVCVEADAGWVPHYKYRMDHSYKRHRYWLKCDELECLPSEYFDEHIWLTFQDDWTAFKLREWINIDRLMWANDFPHSDATWPWSQEMLAEHTADMTEYERNRIVHDNVAELYGLNIAA